MPIHITPIIFLLDFVFFFNKSHEKTKEIMNWSDKHHHRTRVWKLSKVPFPNKSVFICSPDKSTIYSCWNNICKKICLVCLSSKKMKLYTCDPFLKINVLGTVQEWMSSGFKSHRQDKEVRKARFSVFSNVSAVWTPFLVYLMFWSN